MFLGAVTLWATYRVLALITDRRWALVGTALIGFIPQFIFISAAASNDNAINALAALVLWRLVALVVTPPKAKNQTENLSVQPIRRPVQGWSTPQQIRTLRSRSTQGAQSDFWPGSEYSRKDWGSALALGCLLGLALLSKLSALGLVALTGLTLLLAAWRAHSWRTLIVSSLAVGLPALAIAGWWYGRNWALYHDPLAWNIWQANILLRMIPAGWGTIIAELGSLERSFWGLFGWLNVPYPTWVYAAFRVLAIGFTLGLLLHVVRWLIALAKRNRPAFDWRWAGGWLLILWLGLLAFSWVRFMRIAPAAQGRYFFPAAPVAGAAADPGAGRLPAVGSLGARNPPLRGGGSPRHWYSSAPSRRSGSSGRPTGRRRPPRPQPSPQCAPSWGTSSPSWASAPSRPS